MPKGIWNFMEEDIISYWKKLDSMLTVTIWPSRWNLPVSQLFPTMLKMLIKGSERFFCFTLNNRELRLASLDKLALYKQAHWAQTHYSFIHHHPPVGPPHIQCNRDFCILQCVISRWLHILSNCSLPLSFNPPFGNTAFVSLTVSGPNSRAVHDHKPDTT